MRPRSRKASAISSFARASVAHAETLLLSSDREGLRQQRVERLAACRTLAELHRHGLQRCVVELLELWLERVDLLHDAAIGLEQPIVAATENRGEKLGQHAATGLGCGD